MYITRKKLQEIIKNAPTGTSPQQIVDGLVSRGNTLEGYNEKPGLLKNIGREIAKPFVQGTELLGQAALATGAVAKAGIQSATGRKEQAKQTLTKEAQRIESSRQKPIRLLGADVNRITNEKQAMGSALNLASNFIGGGGVAKTAGAGVKTGVLAAVKAGVKAGAKSGVLYGAGDAMSEDRNVLGGALMGGAGGAITGAAMPVVIGGGIKAAKIITSPFSTAINKIAPALEKAAIKVENVITKPSKTDIAHGFKADNVFKYKLGGGIGQSLQKTESLIRNLVSKAENLRGKSKSTIDLNTIVNSVADDLSTGGVNKLGMNKKIYNAFKSFVKELEDVAPTGKMNTVDAQKAKVALGKMGSWLNGTKDLDANASETVANALYTKFKVAIENAVDDPAELKAINKQLSEIIPIQNVLLKRIPVAERNSALSLTDIITAGSGMVDPKGWGLFAVNRLSKSGQFAEGLYKGAQKLKSGATKLLPLEVKLKNIKPGLTIQDVSPKGKGEILKTTPLKTYNYRSSHQIRDGVEIKSVNLDKLKEEAIKLDGYISNERLKDFNKLKKLQESGGKVTIYRASPINELNSGDWVTTNRSYANNIKQQNGGKVYSYDVDVNDLRLPKNISDNPSGARFSAFQYNKSTKLKSSVEPLVQEAKKYKTADEFVRKESFNQMSKYEWHLSDNPNLVEGKLMSEQVKPKNIGSRGFAGREENIGDVFSTKSPQWWYQQLAFENRGKAPKNVYLVEVKNPQKPDIMDGLAQQSISKPDEIRIIKKAGGINEIENPYLLENIKKSQLTDIWNKANKKLKK